MGLPISAQGLRLRHVCPKGSVMAMEDARASLAHLAARVRTPPDAPGRLGSSRDHGRKANSIWTLSSWQASTLDGPSFGVGRPVLREALRSLEQLGVIEMGVGSSSGLRIVSPDPTAIVQPAQRHLRREGLDDHHRRQVRDLLENLRANERPPSHIGSLFQQILAT